MSAVLPANNTYSRIELLVRRLTAASGESALKSTEIQQTINDIYNSDFPYAIKLDQMRSVYTFFTEPNRDRYPLDVNYSQGVRDPIYVDGIQGFFFKDRQQFFNMYPRWPTLFKPINGDGTTATFTFNVPGPFLSNNVNLGGVAVGGNPILVGDDGNGNLQLQVPNPVVSVPAQTSSAPGMKNLNTANPGQDIVTNIGTVDYVSGNCTITFPAGYIPASGTQVTMHVSQYATGRPYTVLFWNNEFTIRPVPKRTHKIEVEVYLTPVQFMQTTDNPILNQWVKYLAYASAIEILRQRQDIDGVNNLMEGFKRQEALVLERQGVEEINQRNATIFAGSTPSQGWNNGFMQGWW